MNPARTTTDRPLFLLLGLALLGALGLATARAAEPTALIQPSPFQRENLRRSLTLLATSTPEHRNTVRVLFYGQSITEQAWWKKVAAALRTQYPKANLVIENRAIGGHAAQLLVKTAEADLDPFQPDLLIFHVYGAHTAYEELIRRVRERTTADILLQTDHITQDAALNEETDPARLSPKQWDAWMNSVFLPQTAARYDACLADVHEAWKKYLREHHLPASALLRDGVHLNAAGEELLAKLIIPYLGPLPPKAGYDPWNNREVQTQPVQAKGTNLHLNFEGRRVDLVLAPGARGPFRIRIDGKSPSEHPELFGFTRTTAFPQSNWPMILRVGSRSPLQEETWTLRLTGIATNGTAARFTLRGSLTGEDGEGTSTQPFVSKSGRIVLDPADWNLGYCYSVFKRAVPDGQEIQWQSELRGASTVIPKPDAFGGEIVVTVAQGLSPGPHVLEVEWDQPNQAAEIRAVRSYRPRGTTQTSR